MHRAKVLRAMIDQLAADCTVLAGPIRVAFVVARASPRSCAFVNNKLKSKIRKQLTLWDILCLVTSSFRQIHKWHCLLYTDCMDWHRRTAEVRRQVTRIIWSRHTLDFFRRHRSQALHTRFLILSCDSIEPALCEDMGNRRRGVWKDKYDGRI